jgi:alanyl-tRNA synthetase
VTERLYYHDSFLREFDAQVLSCEPEGDRWKVILDRTAFYPTSGGQPHDLGKLGDAAVLEIVEDAAGAENKQIIHYTSAAVPVGAVHGQIDWTRRLDHMQQHTGQHLLSAAFVELFEFHTVSFHLGREVSTIDLDAPSIVPRQLEEAERLTNEIILEDRIVAVRFGTAEELAEAGVRKQVDREGVLRAIEIEGFDRQPCGGTHLARTGQAGLLLIRKAERRRESWRVEYVCGFRALTAAREGFATLTQVASLLSCGFPDLPIVLARMIEERRGLHGSVKRLEGRLAEHEARALLAGVSSQNPGAARVVVAAIEDATPGYLVLLTASLTAQAGVVALIASRSSGHVAFAQSKELSGDMGALLRATLKEFGGKGGGPKDFARGSVADASVVDKLLARARELVATQR